MAGQDVQARVQEAISTMLQDLDTSCVRRKQAEMHLCASRCCENQSASMEEVHGCIQKCSTQIISIQNYIQSELGSYQDRIQRCALDCKDQVSDKITSDTTEAEAMKYKGLFESCISQCADTHIQLVPGMLRRMKRKIQKENL